MIYFGSMTPVGKDVLDDLIRKSELVHGCSSRRYALFSRSGFEGLSDDDATLYTIEDLLDPRMY